MTTGKPILTHFPAAAFDLRRRRRRRDADSGTGDSSSTLRNGTATTSFSLDFDLAGTCPAPDDGGFSRSCASMAASLLRDAAAES